MLNNLLKKEKEDNVVPISYPKIAVGLDIGTTKVVAFAGKRGEHDKVEILGSGICQSIGVQKGRVVNINETVNAINKVIRQCQDDANINIDTVMVGVAGQYIESFKMSGEIKRHYPDTEISQGDIRQLTKDMFKTPVDPGSKIIDIIPQEYYVDNYPAQLNPIGTLGTKLSSVFNIITGNEQHLKNIGRCIKKCNLQMDALILEPIASSEVILDRQEKETGVALVDIGGGTSDIAVYIDGVLRHTAIIPIAGDVITNDIKTVFKGITKEQAEQLKVKHGACLVDASESNQVIAVPGIHERAATEINKVELSEVIRARTKEIIERIIEELKNSDCLDKIGCGIVFTGGGSKLKGLKELTELTSGVGVRIGNPEEKIELNEGNKEYKDAIYSTCLGLMVLGIERDEDLHEEGIDIPVQQTEPKEKKEEQENVDEKKAPSFRVWNLLKSLFMNNYDDYNDDNDDNDDRA